MSIVFLWFSLLDYMPKRNSYSTFTEAVTAARNVAPCSLGANLGYRVPPGNLFMDAK